MLFNAECRRWVDIHVSKFYVKTDSASPIDRA